MKKSCAIFTNIAPLYSKLLWYELASSQNVDYYFYSSEKGFSGIETIDIKESRFVCESGRLNWHFIKNIYIKNHLVYQTGIIINCMRTNYDAYILSGEMYILSNWIAALICKIRGKPLIFWGHGLYGNENRLKITFRLLYYKIADFHLVYANRSRRLMTESGFNPERIYVAYNSLDFNLHRKFYNEKPPDELVQLKSRLFPDNPELPVIIFVGRLTREKKLNYLLKAVSLSKNKGCNYNCLIVGGGMELENLRNMSSALGIDDFVYFFGPSYNESVNANLIMLSECCVSPGNVGLTAIHSLSLGTPVITQNKMNNQMPEAESVIEGKTGFYFKENDINDLSDVIDRMILDNKKTDMEANCIKQIGEFWNPAKQVAVFDEAVMNT